MRKKIIFTLLLMFVVGNVNSKENANANEARKLFDHTYNMVFGPQGSTLHYSVNIIGIMNVEGTIWYKGKKSKFVESRYLRWNNGEKEYWVDKKKKTVTLYKAGEAKDKYMSKFSFNADDYKYSYIEKNGTYEVTLDAKKDVKGIKHLKAFIDKKTKAPKYLKIKVLWFWTTVNISKFQSGNISDDTFQFPSSQFKGYDYIDKTKHK